MRELAIAGIWLFFAAGLFWIEGDVRGDYRDYVSRGKWVALALAGVNALRPVVKWGGLRLLRLIGLIPPPPEDIDDEPRRPIVRDDESDDQGQPPPRSIRS